MIAVASLAGPRLFPKSATGLTIVTLALALGSLAAGGWISHAGGQLRHSEFRDGPPPGHVDEK